MQWSGLLVAARLRGINLDVDGTGVGEIAAVWLVHMQPGLAS